MSTKTIDLPELARHARELNRIAIDAKVDRADGLHVVSYDQIHDHCRAVLGALALAGHKRSHELLNPATGRTPEGGAKNPAMAGDSIPPSLEAARMVGEIGI